ncbi:hypothetical protein [Sorangium sp. So ce1182]|uniref:hypothetical protein n=1 Tax=Sorangium sp. So ce1182 TaxID=3133334 RepID=UPI003F617204
MAALISVAAERCDRATRCGRTLAVARATVRRKASDIDFRLLKAEGVNLASRGRLTKSDERDPNGAFLVRSGPLSVGIDLDQDGAGVHPLVGDDWVNEKTAALGRRAPPHGAGNAASRA